MRRATGLALVAGAFLILLVPLLAVCGKPRPPVATIDLKVVTARGDTVPLGPGDTAYIGRGVDSIRRAVP